MRIKTATTATLLAAATLALAACGPAAKLTAKAFGHADEAAKAAKTAEAAVPPPAATGAAAHAEAGGAGAADEVGGVGHELAGQGAEAGVEQVAAPGDDGDARE